MYCRIYFGLQNLKKKETIILFKLLCSHFCVRSIYNTGFSKSNEKCVLEIYR